MAPVSRGALGHSAAASAGQGPLMLASLESDREKRGKGGVLGLTDMSFLLFQVLSSHVHSVASGASLWLGSVLQYIKSKGCLSSTTDMVFNKKRTNSNQNLVSVSDLYYMPELLAYNALALIETTIDKGKVRNGRFNELTVDEKAVFVRCIKNTNPACEIFTTNEMQTFARQLLNMCFQSFQKRRYLATIVASVSNTNFSLPTFSDSRTTVGRTRRKLLEGVRASAENKVRLSICLAAPWSETQGSYARRRVSNFTCSLKHCSSRSNRSLTV